jgi:peptidoglycan/xylan/chitin deacetylase (PgdA/CDA1 family)
MLLLLLVVCLLIIPVYIIYKPPYLLLHFFQQRWPDVLWHVQASKKIMALTIDDGPSEYTNEILQILKASNTTATFFIIGSQVAGRENTLRDLIRHNNELANHAMYDEPSRFLGDAELSGQIHAVQSKISEAYTSVGIEVPPLYFRPGSGIFGTAMRQIVAEMGYRLVLGNVYPHDPHIPFWRINAAHVLSMSRPGGIIICHDGRSWTAPMLRKVLPEMKRRGYRIVTVTELLEEAKD